MYVTAQEWDKDKDGRLDYREFAAIFQPPGSASYPTSTGVESCCQVLDADLTNSGRLVDG